MKVLLWDLDDTLYDLLAPFKKACEAVLGENLADSEFTYRRFRFRGDEVFEASQRGEMGLEESRILRFCRAMEDCGYEMDREEALRFQKLYEEEQGKISLSSCMREILTEWKDRGIPMGIVTNGPEEHQKRKCRALGMEAWISDRCLVISGAVGSMKPEREIFHMAAKIMEAAPEDLSLIHI